MDKYFAALPSDEIGKACMDRVDQFYIYARSSGLYSRVSRSCMAYYGQSSNTSSATSLKLTFGGEEGELTFVKANHFRNIGQHMLTLTTSQRPAPIPIATNTDEKSQGQAILGVGLCDYYSKEKRVERVLRSAAELAVVTAEGFVLTEWNPRHGSPYSVDEFGTVVRQGDVECTYLSPLDVIRDPMVSDSSKAQWHITRQKVSKYELAAENPAYADKILSLSIDKDDLRFFPTVFNNDSDQIYLYKLWHKPSSAVPEGRQVFFVSQDAVLFDGPLAYEDVQVRRLAPGDLMDSPYGYSPMFDLLALQEVLDALYSAVVTNQLTFGVQNIWVPNNSNISFRELANGLNVISGSADGKPESINLTQTPGEIFQFIEQIEGLFETLSGINATVRGNPEASLKSGSALALVQSQAIQFSSGLQASYAALVEDVYTDIIKTLQRYADTNRIVMIAGKHNRYLLKNFTKKDLSGISRIVIDQAGSLSKTQSGRVQMAQDLMKSGLIRLPEEYLSVVNTGKLESMTESDQRQLMLIRGENERLADGIKCMSMPTDNHILHIKEHGTVLDDPELRIRASTGDPEANKILQGAYQHIIEHVSFAGDPALFNLISSLGYQPIAPPMPAEQAAGGTPAKDAQPASQPGGEPVQPNYPVNPATGEQWNPEDGGDAMAATQAV